MIRQLAEDFYNNCYAMPPGPTELAEFAELVLNKFIKELENNKQTVAWNYGCDSVIFYKRDLESKSLLSIKEEFNVDRDNKGNTTESHGRGT